MFEKCQQLILCIRIFLNISIYAFSNFCLKILEFFFFICNEPIDFALICLLLSRYRILRIFFQDIFKCRDRLFVIFLCGCDLDAFFNGFNGFCQIFFPFLNGLIDLDGKIVIYFFLKYFLQSCNLFFRCFFFITVGNCFLNRQSFLFLGDQLLHFADFRVIRILFLNFNKAIYLRLRCFCLQSLCNTLFYNTSLLFQVTFLFLPDLIGVFLQNLCGNCRMRKPGYTILMDDFNPIPGNPVDAPIPKDLAGIRYKNFSRKDRTASCQHQTKN